MVHRLVQKLLHGCINDRVGSRTCTCVCRVCYDICADVQVNKMDLSSRTAVDVCTPGSEIARMLSQKLLSLESKADEMASKPHKEEADCCPRSGGKTVRKKRIGQRCAPSCMFLQTSELLSQQVRAVTCKMWCYTASHRLGGSARAAFARRIANSL